MAQTALTRVRSVAAKLPDAEEGTTFGFPAFKVGGKAFAWFPKTREVEPGSLGVRMSILERAVLARVLLMNDEALGELLAAGHEFMGRGRRIGRHRGGSRA